MDRFATARSLQQNRRVHQTTGRQIIGDKIVTAERFEFDSIEPEQTAIPANSEVAVNVTFQTDDAYSAPALAVDQDHPDDCSEFRVIRRDKVGALFKVELESTVTEYKPEECYSLLPLVGGGATSVQKYTKRLTATAPPTEGRFTVTARLIGAQSGNVYDTISTELTVEETATEPGDGEDGSGDDKVVCGPIQRALGNCGDGDNGNGGGSFLGTQQTIALAAFTILVIVAFGVTR